MSSIRFGQAGVTTYSERERQYQPGTNFGAALLYLWLVSLDDIGADNKNFNFYNILQNFKTLNL